MRPILNLLIEFVVLVVVVVCHTGCVTSLASIKICYGTAGDGEHAYYFKEVRGHIVVSSLSPTLIHLRSRGITCWEECWKRAPNCTVVALDGSDGQGVRCLLYGTQARVLPSRNASKKFLFQRKSCGVSRFANPFCSSQQATREPGFWIRYHTGRATNAVHLGVSRGSHTNAECLEHCLQHPQCTYVDVKKGVANGTNMANMECTLAQATAVQPEVGVEDLEMYLWRSCGFSPIQSTDLHVRPPQVSTNCMGRFIYQGVAVVWQDNVVANADVQSQAQCLHICSITPSSIISGFFNQSGYVFPLDGRRWNCLCATDEPRDANVSSIIGKGHTWRWHCQQAPVLQLKIPVCVCTKVNTRLYFSYCSTDRQKYTRYYSVPQHTGLRLIGGVGNGASTRVKLPVDLTVARLGWVSTQHIRDCKSEHCRYYDLESPAPHNMYVSPKAWYAYPAVKNCNPFRFRQLPTYVVLLNTVTPRRVPCYGTACAALLRGIQREHQLLRGRCFVSSNYYISNDGYIYEGRGADVESATLKALWNQRSIAVSFIGYFETVMPSAAAINAVMRLTDDLVSQKKVASNFELVTRFDIEGFEIPGVLLRNISRLLPFYRGKHLEIKTCFNVLPFHRFAGFAVSGIAALLSLALLVFFLVASRLVYNTQLNVGCARIDGSSSSILHANQICGDAGDIERFSSITMNTVTLVTVCTRNTELALRLNAKYDQHEWVDTDTTVSEFVAKLHPIIIECCVSCTVLIVNTPKATSIHFVPNDVGTKLNVAIEQLITMPTTATISAFQSEMYIIKGPTDRIAVPLDNFSRRRTYATYMVIYNPLTGIVQRTGTWLLHSNDFRRDLRNIE